MPAACVPIFATVTYGSKPLRVTRTLYVPGGKPSSVTMPAAFVVAVRVVGPAATTSAPPTGLPASSRTLETIAPSATCCAQAHAGALLKTAQANRAQSGGATFKSC